MGSLFEVVLILVLVIANAVFAMSETAIVASRRARLQQRAEEGDGRAARALALADDPNVFLATVQIGIHAHRDPRRRVRWCYGRQPSGGRSGRDAADRTLCWHHRHCPSSARDHLPLTGSGRVGAEAYSPQQPRGYRLVGGRVDEQAILHHRTIGASSGRLDGCVAEAVARADDGGAAGH